ncbi:MAG: conjugal transfer protein TrbE [Endozoicomonas sp. (ex Botrylloides leachii)]|nr:conjugal transfer protein TrbE [Endozoicomonas sp. (ex Botrylloides leachii)]
MLSVITYLIAGLGVFLVLILAQRIYRVDQDLNLKKHRSKDAGLVDLLNHAAMVDDGVIVGKNGSLMAAWIYRGPDHNSATDNEKENVIARINQALANKMDSGWMLHVDAVREPAPKYFDREASSFPDALTEAIDEERRRMFESMGTMYRGYFVLTVTWFPPLLAQQKFVELLFDDDTPPLEGQARTQSIIDQFKKDCSTLADDLGVVLSMERLSARKVSDKTGNTITHDLFLQWLQYCVTGIKQPIVLPKNPIYLDAIIGGQDLWSGVVPRIGDKFIQVVSLEGLPMESYPGILSALAEVTCEYRWSNRFIFIDNHEAIAHIEKYRKKWRQKVRGFVDKLLNNYKGAIDQDAADMVNDAEAALADVNSGLITQGYYTSVVVIMDENRIKLTESVRTIRQMIQKLGFAARVEDINTMDAWLGSIPGHGVENIRRPLINTLNFSDLIPTSSIWTGREHNPCPFYPKDSPPLMACIAQGTTQFLLNFHVGDLGHTSIIGSPGGGKSTFLLTTLAQFMRYERAQVFAFDKGNSAYTLAAGIQACTNGRSGLHFDLGADDSSIGLCPLQYLETRSDKAWACEWIELLLSLSGIDIGVFKRSLIREAIENMSHRSQSRSLSDFATAVQDSEIREALSAYLIDGPMGNLLDAQTDDLTLSDFTVFEMATLMNMGAMYVMPVLSYLFRRIERSLDGRPTVISLDEAWLMFRNKMFSDRFEEWLRVFRKENAIVLFSTQGIDDAKNAGLMSKVISWTASNIFLPNPEANTNNPDIYAIYQAFGLRDPQINIVAKATKKRDYFVFSEEGQRLFQLGLGKLALSFVGVSDKEEVAAVKKLERTYGDEWIHHWMSRRNVDHTLFDKRDDIA